MEWIEACNDVSYWWIPLACLAPLREASFLMQRLLGERTQIIMTVEASSVHNQMKPSYPSADRWGASFAEAISKLDGPSFMNAI